MRKITLFLLTLLIPIQSFASCGSRFTDSISELSNIISPILLYLLFIYFIYGIYKFFFLKSKEKESKKKGRDIIFNSIAYMLIILMIWGILGSL